MTSIEERLTHLEAALFELQAKCDSLADGQFDSITLSTGLSIVDQGGLIRATFRLIENGIGLAIWDSNGRIGLSITGDESRTRISLADHNGQIRADIKLGEAGDPILALNDADGNPRLSASVLDGAPRLMLHDEENLRLALGTDPLPSLEMYGADETTRLSMGLGEGDAAGLGLYDTYGQPRVQVAVCEGGDPEVAFYDERQNVVGKINESALEIVGLHASQYRGEGNG